MRRGYIKVIDFEGEHKVTENLGYNHSVGMYAKAVMLNGGERIVVSRSRSGPWQVNRPVVDVSGLAERLIRQRALEKKV